MGDRPPTVPRPPQSSNQQQSSISEQDSALNQLGTSSNNEMLQTISRVTKYNEPKVIFHRTYSSTWLIIVCNDYYYNHLLLNFNN